MAKLYLDSNETFILSSATTVFGRAGGSEKIVINASATNVVVDANIERVDFAGNVSAFTFQGTGNQIKVYSGGTLVATSTVQEGNTGTLMAFANGTVAVKVGVGGMTLGGSAVSATAGTVTPISIDTGSASTATGGSGGTGSQTIAVSAAGSVTETSATNTTFNIASGTYTYNIAGFGTGDKLAFPTAGLATIINASTSDGIVDVQYANAGQTVTIHLTGIPSATDATILGTSSFNTAFGAGSLN